MKFLIFLLSVLVMVQSLPMEIKFKDEWENFKNKFGKKYESEEEERHRLLVFLDKLEDILEHNMKQELGHFSHTKGISQFADMTAEEFNSTYLGLNMTGFEYTRDYYVPSGNVQLSDKLDWRTKGAVTPVKNQGSCGSCWAFSATGAMEGSNFVSTGKLVSLSEQNLMDCSHESPNESCSGGLMSVAFKYVKDNGGINTEESYPYTAQNSDTCKYNSSNSGGKVIKIVSIQPGDEKSIEEALNKYGPISVGVDASQWSDYNGGVYRGPCSSEGLNHGVLIVGYDTAEDGTSYWIIKNSWGAFFGHDGYIYLEKGKNRCGVAEIPVFTISS